jgi:hypothetical protein
MEIQEQFAERSRHAFQRWVTKLMRGGRSFLEGRFHECEDWRRLKIVNPDERTIFNVEGRGPYKELGMTELFFEGAEPSLADVPLAELLDLFPEGDYEFDGRTVDGADLDGTATFSHAIPAGPVVTATLGPSNSLVIGWTPVTSPPPGFPNEPITIAGYQVIVGSFQATVPSTTTSLTVSPEFVASLPAGTNPFEVLAIEASGNQTLTEGSFQQAVRASPFRRGSIQEANVGAVPRGPDVRGRRATRLGG